MTKSVQEMRLLHIHLFSSSVMMIDFRSLVSHGLLRDVQLDKEL